MRKKVVKIVGGLLLAVSLVLNIFLYQKTQLSSNLNKVIKVLDGDTFLLNSAQRVRLLGASAPEMENCGGKEAKKRLEELVLNRNVKLDEPFIDQYSRVIALVYVENVMVNEILLKEGWARYDGTGKSQKETLKQAYEEAFSQKKGIFSPLCRAEQPDKPNCLIKGNIDKATGTKTYHFPGCREFNTTVVEKDLGEDWFCSEEEAQKAGFQKSQNCYGKKYTL